MMMVFSCFRNEYLRRERVDGDDYPLKLQSHLLNFVHSTPLNILVWALRDIGWDDLCAELLSTYEEFLAVLNCKDTRDHLGVLSQDHVYEDETFLKCREISHRLQATLKKLCFEVVSPLREFACEYGLF